MPNKTNYAPRRPRGRYPIKCKLRPKTAEGYMPNNLQTMPQDGGAAKEVLYNFTILSAKTAKRLDGQS